MTRNSARYRSIEGMEEPSRACFNGAAQPFATAMSEETGVADRDARDRRHGFLRFWDATDAPGLTSVRLAL